MPKPSTPAPSSRRAPAKAAPRKRGLKVRAAARTQARDLYRTSILEAAERVFARRGWAATKVADIAREAGLAAGTLYNYFDSKEKILESIIEWRGGQVLEHTRAIADGPGTPLERLAEYTRWMMGHIERDGVAMQIYAQASGGPPPPLAHARHCVTDNHRQHMAISIRLLGLAQADGSVRRDLSAEDLAIALGGIVGGHIGAWLHSSPRSALAARWPRLLDLFLKGASPR